MTNIDISSFIEYDTPINQITNMDKKPFTVRELCVLLADLQNKVIEQKKQLENFQTTPIDSYESKQARNLKIALEQFLELVEPDNNEKEEPEG